MANGKKKTNKVSSEALDAINAAYLAGSQSLGSAETLALEVVAALYNELERSKPKTVHNSANRDLLSKYWDEEYSYRDIVDRESSLNDLKRAVDAVGELSLYSATREQLQAKIAAQVHQRRIAGRLNSLLKFINRDVRLRKNKLKRRPVSFLSLPDFQKLIFHIPILNIRLLIEAAFYSGLRAGELFAVTPNLVRETFIQVNGQMDRAGVFRETKTRTIRKAFIIPEGRNAVLAWAEVKNKRKFRNVELSTLVRKACKSAFPEDSSKYVTFHDLRHSYATHLISKGVSLDLISQSLGNSISVCQDYYSGFVLSDDSVASIEARFN